MREEFGQHKTFGTFSEAMSRNPFSMREEFGRGTIEQVAMGDAVAIPFQ